MKHILIFTDGACRGNPGPGGWAALLRYGTQEKMISGGDAHTTNNRMELMAAIKALASLKERCTIELYTDSQYVQKGITLWLPDWVKRHWKTAAKKPVKNADLWQELQIHTQKHTVSWHWVRGHNGHVENERVDIAANLAIDKFLAKGSKKIT